MYDHWVVGPADLTIKCSVIDLGFRLEGSNLALRRESCITPEAQHRAGKLGDQHRR